MTASSLRAAAESALLRALMRLRRRLLDRVCHRLRRERTHQRPAVRSHPAMEWDTGMYHSVGLDPTEAGLVFVKSPSHFRVAYGPFADRILMADTPGPTLGNMRNLVLKRAPRPLYPLDEATWSPS